MSIFPKQPDKAFTLLELMVVIAAMACVAFVFLENFSRARAIGCRNNCSMNLKQVGLSFLLWGGDNGEQYPMQVVAANGGPFQQAAIADGTGAAFVYQIFQVMSN